MVRVEITNYESIEHAIVEIEGFTTVQGPNYTGKSATMRAINAALTNQSGMAFISWGKTFCEVHLQSEGFDLLWHKEEGNNFYDINGTKYTKIGEGEPPAELEAFGYGTVNVNDVRHNLHYADQFDTLFLVDEQNTKSTDLITSAYGLDRLYKAQELCSKDQRSAAALLKIRRKDLGYISEDIKKFDGLDDVLQAGETIKAAKTAIGEQEGKISRAKAWFLSMTQSATDCSKLKPVASVALPVSDVLSETNATYVKIQALVQKLEESSTAVHRLSSVESTSVPSAGDLSSRAEAYKNLSGLFLAHSKAQADVDKLLSHKEVVFCDNEVVSAMFTSVGVLLSLKKSVDDLLVLKKDADGLTAEMKVCAQELEEVMKERATFDSCPLCGKTL